MKDYVFEKYKVKPSWGDEPYMLHLPRKDSYIKSWLSLFELARPSPHGYNRVDYTIISTSAVHDRQVVFTITDKFDIILHNILKHPHIR